MNKMTPVTLIKVRTDGQISLFFPQCLNLKLQNYHYSKSTTLFIKL